jgi:dienelactone hydrolase
MTARTRLVDYTHDGAELEGFFACDEAAETPLPGILVAHAWSGRSPMEDRKAEELAGLGYAAFALDLYGKGVRGTSREENAGLMRPFLDNRAMLQSRLQRALAVLQEQPEVDATRTAAIGFCFGGLCVLDLARSGAEVAGVVSFHGLFGAPSNIESPSIAAKILALHGWDDPMVPPEQVLALSEELTAAGADWQLHAYGGTMHAFTNPDARDAGHGTVYDAVADRRSWRAMQDFLDELFAV